MIKKRYKIVVRLLQGNIFTYHVDDYKIEEGFVSFIDAKTGIPRLFHGSNCEITEIGGSNE